MYDFTSCLYADEIAYRWAQVDGSLTDLFWYKGYRVDSFNTLETCGRSLAVVLLSNVLCNSTDLRDTQAKLEISLKLQWKNRASVSSTHAMRLGTRKCHNRVNIGGTDKGRLWKDGVFEDSIKPI